jgi:hopanoid biosynthesis associated RND transporter like protein HpnN
MLQSWINKAARYCVSHFRSVIVAALLLTVIFGVYAARHFAIDTDVNDLLSEKLPWRQNEIGFDAAFPQVADIILVDVGASSPEAAKAAARDVKAALANKPDLFRSITDALDSPFFRQNGLLFLAPDRIEQITGPLTKAQPLVGALVRDPSLRGVSGILVEVVQAAEHGLVPIDQMARPLNLASATLDEVAQDRPTEFSWRVLLQGAPKPLDLHRFILVWPVLDHNSLEPGGKATAAIREIVDQLDLPKKFGAEVSLTGPVIISDNEFAGVHEGIALNSAVTGAIVLIILWLALRSLRLVAAVAVNIAVGLAITAAGGIFMVGALNPISLAFAVLFVGLGADFAIQYTIRYRAERHDLGDTDRALGAAADWVGIPLSLAAGAAAAGFLSFTPTAYKGLSQLGVIAGFGMVIAYVTSLTLLPALIHAVKPPAEPKRLDLPALAKADAFLKRHRIAVIVTTVAIVVAGLPALTRLQFNFNPLALEKQTSPALIALYRLGKEVPFATAKVVVPPADAAAAVAKLSALPQVAATWTLENFVPSDQEPKLTAVAAAKKKLDPALHAAARGAPSDADNIAALNKAAGILREAADQTSGASADAARRLATALDKLAQADPGQRARATDAFIVPLQLDLDDLGASLSADHVTRASLPPELVRDWVAPDGRMRIEVWPKGDANDNANIARFAHAVLAAEPGATGEAIESTEWGGTIVEAFVEAAALALFSIAALLFLVLRRFVDVLVTLIPLIVAAIVTLEICALAKFQLNYANIIALPVLLGIGVAFKIYYVTAWRRGESNFLESVLTRAVFYSTLLTATAFGSLWLSNQPGISSMGKLLALSLVCTLASAALFQPALMGGLHRPKSDADKVG